MVFNIEIVLLMTLYQTILNILFEKEIKDGLLWVVRIDMEFEKKEWKLGNFVSFYQTEFKY
jgi:hypothetical protein